MLLAITVLFAEDVVVLVGVEVEVAFGFIDVPLTGASFLVVLLVVELGVITF